MANTGMPRETCRWWNTWAIFGVSHQAAMQALRRLEDIGVVSESSGKQRGRIYLATEIVRAVE
jgi:DNA-binding PadR family transcriptional regulator